MNDLEELGPWTKAQGDVLAVLIAGRPTGCCDVCARLSAVFCARGLCAALYCVHSQTGATVLMSDQGKTVGQWRMWPEAIETFTARFHALCTDAIRLCDYARATGDTIKFFDVDDLDRQNNTLIT